MGNTVIERDDGFNHLCRNRVQREVLAQELDVAGHWLDGDETAAAVLPCQIYTRQPDVRAQVDDRVHGRHRTRKAVRLVEPDLADPFHVTQVESVPNPDIAHETHCPGALR